MHSLMNYTFWLLVNGEGRFSLLLSDLCVCHWQFGREEDVGHVWRNSS